VASAQQQYDKTKAEPRAVTESHQRSPSQEGTLEAVA